MLDSLAQEDTANTFLGVYRMCVQWLYWSEGGQAGQGSLKLHPLAQERPLGLNAVSLPPHHHLSVFFPRKDQAMYQDLDDVGGAG